MDSQTFPAMVPLPASTIVQPKSEVDVAHLFLAFTSHLGDVAAVASECGVSIDTVQAIADSEQWNKKLRHLLDLSKTGNPGDWEKAHNRATNLVQLVRLRRIMDRMLTQAEKWKDEELFITSETLTSGAKGETKTTTYGAKIFSDVAAALEKIQQLTYVALSDTLGERKDLRDADPVRHEKNAASMHKALVQLLNRPDRDVAPSTVGLLASTGATTLPIGEARSEVAISEAVAQETAKIEVLNAEIRAAFQV